jgi:hypothetical protein
LGNEGYRLTVTSERISMRAGAAGLTCGQPSSSYSSKFNAKVSHVD